MDNETFVVEFAGESVTIRPDFGLWEDIGAMLDTDPLILIAAIIDRGEKAKMTPLIKAVLAVSSGKSIDQINDLFRKEPGPKMLTTSYVIWAGLIKAQSSEVGGETDKDTRESEAA